MAVAVVIQNAVLENDGFIHALGTVAGGAAISIAPVNLNDLLGMTVAQIQVYIALLLCIAAMEAGQDLSGVALAALQTTVNF